MKKEKRMKSSILKRKDAARLMQELTERLEEQLGVCDQKTLIARIRRVIEAGVQAVAQAEHTVSLREAAEASIRARAGRRPCTLRDLRHFVRRILRVEGVGERSLRAMSTRECRDILTQAFSGSRHSYTKGRAILHSIFAYGLRQEWCAENPVSRIEVHAPQEKEIKPLSLPEIRRLEQAARHPKHADMQLSLHLMLYCGVRPQEVARLSPQDIRQEQRRVIIHARSSKTGGGRVIPLHRAAQLKGINLRIPRNWKNRWKQLRRAAGYAPGEWQPDACRHTFASYHAAYFQNLPALQLEMGHRSADLLRTRYLNLPAVEEAKRYWG